MLRGLTTDDKLFFSSNIQLFFKQYLLSPNLGLLLGLGFKEIVSRVWRKVRGGKRGGGGGGGKIAKHWGEKNTIIDNRCAEALCFGHHMQTGTVCEVVPQLQQSLHS